MFDFLPSVRYAFRSLGKAPGFSLLCILTLAVAIGANTAVFSVVDGVLLSPLPYPEADRLVGLWHTAPGLGMPQMPQSEATYLLYADQAKTLEGIALYEETSVNLTGSGTPERLPAAIVTSSLFEVLRVFPRLGRGFRADDGAPGAPAVVLLSDELWKRRFGGDPKILGSFVRIDGVQHEVIGVMPPGFEFPSPDTALWEVRTLDPARAELGNFGPLGVARLAPGVSCEDAQKGLDRLLVDLEERFPQGDAAPILARAGFAAVVHRLQDDVVGQVRDFLWVLMGAVGFVLLIACANVANLLIVRGEGRQREMAVAAALGATPGALLRTVLVESAWLGLTAGVVGLGIAAGAIRLLHYLEPGNLPRLAQVTIDGRVLAFTLVVSMVTSLLFGLIPALRASRIENLASRLRSGGRSLTTGRSGRRSRRLLVGAQIALVLVLLTGSGLMLRSFLRLADVDPGFRADHTLTFQLSLPASDYPTDASVERFVGVLSQELAALPGVESVGATSSLPLSGRAAALGHDIEGLDIEAGAPPPVLWVERIDEGYLDAMGIPLRRGRALERGDAEHRTGAVLINEALARHFWPQGDALGRRLRPGDGPDAPWYTVVGVVGDVRHRFLTADEPEEMVYYPLLGRMEGAWVVRRLSLVMHTRIPPRSLVGPLQYTVWTLDSDLPVSNVRTLEDLVDGARARMRFSVILLALATAVALLLGGVGVYGFVSFMVSQRRPEVGVRLAVGANRGEIRRMVLTDSLSVAWVGLAVGLLGAAALTRGLTALLFQVQPLDPATFATVPLLLLALVVLASYLPAERAARVDPAEALLRKE